MDQIFQLPSEWILITAVSNFSRITLVDWARLGSARSKCSELRRKNGHTIDCCACRTTSLNFKPAAAAIRLHRQAARERSASRAADFPASAAGRKSHRCEVCSFAPRTLTATAAAISVAVARNEQRQQIKMVQSGLLSLFLRARSRANCWRRRRLFEQSTSVIM